MDKTAKNETMKAEILAKIAMGKKVKGFPPPGRELKRTGAAKGKKEKTK